VICWEPIGQRFFAVCFRGGDRVVGLFSSAPSVSYPAQVVNGTNGPEQTAARHRATLKACSEQATARRTGGRERLRPNRAAGVSRGRRVSPIFLLVFSGPISWDKGSPLARSWRAPPVRTEPLPTTWNVAYLWAAGELSTSRARRLAAVLVSTPSLAKMSRTCFFTVDSLLQRIMAISPLVLP
jgi:hypothetical protein